MYIKARRLMFTFPFISNIWCIFLFWFPQCVFDKSWGSTPVQLGSLFLVCYFLDSVHVDSDSFLRGKKKEKQKAMISWAAHYLQVLLYSCSLKTNSEYLFIGNEVHGTSVCKQTGWRAPAFMLQTPFSGHGDAPTTWKQRQEDEDFKVSQSEGSLGSTKACLKTATTKKQTF